MKQMMLGIFLLVLSIWCLIDGKLDDLTILLFAGSVLPIAAIVCFFVGFFAKEEKRRDE